MLKIATRWSWTRENGRENKRRTYVVYFRDRYERTHLSTLITKLE